MGKNRETALLLRELRVESGRSLRKAASELGVAPSHLSRLERGEKSPGSDLRRRAANYYGVHSDVLELAEGRVPPDILRILQAHPELLDALRRKYAQVTEYPELP